MKNLYEQGEALLRLAEREANYVQVHISAPLQQKLELLSNKTDSFTSTEHVSYAVLVYVNGRSGTSVSNTFSPAVVERAIALAKASSPSEYFYGLPLKQQLHKLQIFDKRITALTEDGLIDIADEMIVGIADETVTLSAGSVTKQVSQDIIFTSEGIQQVEQSTALAIVAECIARKNGMIKSAWDYRQERQLSPLTPFTSALQEKATFFLDSKQLKEKMGIVIVKPEPFADLLEHAFLPNLNGKNNEKGKSCLTGKTDTQVISQKISIYDDALLPFGISSRACDLEGSPSQRTPLFSRGVLKNFIYDYNTALHTGKASTGNGGFSSIDFTNVVVEGEYQEVDKALVIDSVIGAHTADEVATDFSVTVERAYILKDGEKVPVTGFMLSGKMFDALQKAISLGKERKSYNGIYTGALATTGVNIILS